MTKTVYHFGGGAALDDPRARDKTVVGGKGANLAEMAGIGLPVPPGFTITTEECLAYNAGGRTLSDALKAEIKRGIAHIEKATGCRFGVPGAGVPGTHQSSTLMGPRCWSRSARARGSRCRA